MTGDGDPTRRRLGLALLVGGAAVVLWELVNLAVAFFNSRGVDRGAVASILVMILVVFLTIGLIGGGLVRALRRERREAVERFLAEEREGRRQDDGREAGPEEA